MADLNINIDEIPDDDFILPECDGMAQIIKTELEELPNNKGTILQVTSEFMAGPMAKRHAREGFLVRDGDGTNSQWKEISAKSLKKLCTAVGHTGMLRNSDELHFKPYHLTVGQRIDKQGKTRNTFTHRPVGGAQTAVATTGYVQTTTAPLASPAMPWQQ